MYSYISTALLRCSSSAAVVPIGRRSLFRNSPFSNSTCHCQHTKNISLCENPRLKPMASISTQAEEPRKPWLLVGLGNPGNFFSGTRHNVGFEFIDYIAEAEGIRMSTVPFIYSFGNAAKQSNSSLFMLSGFIGDVPVMLTKPQTFMNFSGFSVGLLVSYYKIPLEQVLVMFDDMDLPFAKFRLLPKGGHGGHNGMKSIINHLKGSREFPRLRIGIGRPPGEMDTASYVLQSFTRNEREEMEFTFQNGLEGVRILVQDNFGRSATFLNSANSLQTVQSSNY